MPGHPRAEAFKAEGNKYFKGGDFKAAIAKYKEATAIDPNVPAYWSNMSACFEKISEYDQMEEAARSCIKADKAFVKGYFRLATALKAKNDLEGCIKALESGLAVDSANADLKRMKKDLTELTTSIDTGIPPQESEHTKQNKNSDQAEQHQSPNTNNNHKHIMASPKAKMFCWGFAFVAVCVIIGVLAASFKKVPSTEMGVQYNVHKKQLDDATKSGGLFAGPPGYQFVKFPSTFITVDVNNRECVSNDGLLVVFSVTFQYQMIEANILKAITKYRDYNGWANVVEQAGISAIHHSCAEYFISEFQNKRGAIQNTMEDNLKLKLQGNPDTGEEGVEAVVVALQLTYIGLPNEYKAAVAEKQTAEEDIALAIAQRNQETTKADTELLRAKEEARKVKDTANNEAEVLLTEARLKAQETLFSFQKEAEALVEVRNALNLTTEGVLAYLSNRLLAEAGTLRVTTGEPAKLSRRNEL